MLKWSYRLLGIYQYFGEPNVSFSGKLHGNLLVRTQNLSLRSPTLSHLATMPPLSPLLTCIVPKIIYKCLPGMSPTASKDLVDGSAAASHSGVLCPCFLGRGIVSIVSKLIGCSISSESGSGDIGAGVENRCRLFISVLCLAAFSLLGQLYAARS